MKDLATVLQGTEEQGVSAHTARRLQALLGSLLRELRRGTNGSAAAGQGPGGDASLYILLIMVFYGCLAGALILAYTRSRKLESKHDPYHLYIERDWGQVKLCPRGKHQYLL
uniref:Potassium voltage-gated channel subfamily E regulatory subunit 5 n=2 Tax=Anas TaxID=8835 RepID=A0A8B9VM21_9AVES